MTTNTMITRPMIITVNYRVKNNHMDIYNSWDNYQIIYVWEDLLTLEKSVRNEVNKAIETLNATNHKKHIVSELVEVNYTLYRADECKMYEHKLKV